MGKPEDPSYGYEAVAHEFMAIRSNTGCGVVQKWAESLSPGSSVVDVGSGSGKPITAVLINQGLAVSAIDASATMVATFRRQFPRVEIVCEPAEYSEFFGRTFDAVLAVGLIFLLPVDSQYALLHRMARALTSKGRLLFSAPHQVCTWNDSLTGLPSTSIGIEEYSRSLNSSGLRLIGRHIDEGGTHYYEAQKH